MSATEVEERHTKKRRTHSPDLHSSTDELRKNDNNSHDNENQTQKHEKLTPALRYQLDKLAFFVVMYGAHKEKEFVKDIARKQNFPDLEKSLNNEDGLIHDYYDDKKNTLTQPPNKYTPKYIHFPSFIYSSIHPFIGLRYKAAGIIPYCRFPDGRSYMLLGCEDRSKKEIGMDNIWCYFGGKRVPEEAHPAETALRELREETAHVFSEDVMATIKATVFSPYCAKAWYPAGKFVLFFVMIAYDETLPAKFLRNRFKEESELSTECDQTRIAWIPTKLIAQALAAREDTIVLDGEKLKLYRFLVELLRGIYGVQNLLCSDFSAF
mmetsp:Transcript_1420/g.1884  ORF Transcript_1420/g.1884 Transcript_1420/m.1884 type:complete len:323 (-) Transcript_1420:67-1035(-)